METLENKKNPIGIVNKILNYGFKITVIFLFIFLFIGFINPARISELTDQSVSMVKSAFFFKSYVGNVVKSAEEAGYSSSDELENPFATSDGMSYEDQLSAFMNMTDSFGDDESSEEEEESDDYGYAEFFAMSANDDFGGLAEDTDDDDSDSLEYKKAEKIQIKDFRENWSLFKENYPEIASAFEGGRRASLITFFLVVTALIGLYFACGTNKLRKIGYLIIAVASVLVAISMANFVVAYNALNSTMENLELSVIAPKGIPLFIIFSLLSFGMVVALFFTEGKTNKEEKSVLAAKPFQYTYRILALLLFVILFIPSVNPARISENINRNVSLFTSGFAYSVYTKNLQRILVRGWLPESVMRLAWISSLFTCLGVIASAVGSCMSVGNNKLKRIAHYCLLGGSLVSFVSIFGIFRAYNLIASSPNVDRVLPLQPSSAVMFLILFALIFITALISFLLTPAPLADEKAKIEAPYQLFLMILPFLILVFLFSYLPLWGWRYAFFDYNAGDTLSMDAWVGLKWFKAPFENAATRSDILRVLRNTLIMSGLGILFSWLPMIFAIFLSEIKNTTTRKIIQTLTTVPNFISWVLVYAIAFCIFGTEGFISSLMVNNGIWDKGRNMLMGDKGIWIKMWLWGTWKGLGWSAIMYIAAMSGIDQQLYEAATVDGAGRFQKIWHITIPELLPTYLVLLILSVSGILSNGMDQYLCFKNPTNKDPIEVLDLYVYQLTFGQTSSSNIPFSTVVSMFKSLVSVVLLFITNRISKWIRGTSIF